MPTIEQKEEINNHVFGTLNNINDALCTLRFLVAHEKVAEYISNLKFIIVKLERAVEGVHALKDYLVEIDDGSRK